MTFRLAKAGLFVKDFPELFGTDPSFCAQLGQLQDESEGLVDCFGRGKRLGDVGGQEYKIGSFAVSIGILALHTRLEQLAQIVLRPEVVISVFCGFLLQYASAN